MQTRPFSNVGTHGGPLPTRMCPISTCGLDILDMDDLRLVTTSTPDLHPCSPELKQQRPRHLLFDPVRREVLENRVAVCAVRERVHAVRCRAACGASQCQTIFDGVVAAATMEVLSGLRTPNLQFAGSSAFGGCAVLSLIVFGACVDSVGNVPSLRAVAHSLHQCHVCGQ